MFSSLSTYAQAAERLGTRDRRKIDNNTYLERRDAETIAVRLHETDVVTFHANGTAVLNTGGWMTVTTKDRLNNHAPCSRISSVKGRWFVGDSLPYFDGITFTDSGECLNPQDGPDTASEDQTNRAMRRQIKAYTSLYTGERVAELLADAQTGGSRGDCFYCQMRGEDGKPVGDAFGDTEHLTQHLDEGYTMISLAYNALASKGYRDPVLILHMDTDGSMTRAAITRYLSRALLVGVSVK